MLVHTPKNGTTINFVKGNGLQHHVKLHQQRNKKVTRSTSGNSGRMADKGSSILNGEAGQIGKLGKQKKISIHSKTLGFVTFYTITFLVAVMF